MVGLTDMTGGEIKGYAEFTAPRPRPNAGGVVVFLGRRGSDTGCAGQVGASRIDGPRSDTRDTTMRKARSINLADRRTRFSSSRKGNDPLSC